MRRALIAALLAAAAVTALAAPRAVATTLPEGFSEDVLVSGLTEPTAVRFSPDGRIFVAEKSGLVKVFTGPGDASPTVFADLRTNVHNFWDRGLLGLALDPDFPENPYVYVLYTYDHVVGSVDPPPRWGTPGAPSDGCPTPPGSQADGCVASGRLSRLTADGNVMTGAEHVLVEDWCSQFPGHSMGSLAFGVDGALYVSAGDAASALFTDYGQRGDPLNPCGDPPGPPGTPLSPPSAEGGSLRAQDLRTPADPVTLDGAVLRVDPATGEAPATNPLAGSPDPNARRIIAHGLRNPFRITVRPGTNEVWVGDVGWRAWEEVNRIPDGADAVVENFGWPCYEGRDTGNRRQPGWDALDLMLCERLYAEPGAVTAPFLSYPHDAAAGAEACTFGSSAIAGLAFAPEAGGPYPPDYDGALFVADYSRDCIWAVKRGADGLPDVARLEPFATDAANPVELQIARGGELVYVDLQGGAVRRIRFSSENRPPTATASADPTSGDPPLTVTFDGSGSSDPDREDTLAYAWDLDGDGAFDDATDVRPTFTYAQRGIYAARLRVTDRAGATATSDPVMIGVGNGPPTVTVAEPTPAMRWAVDDLISFRASATDPEDGPLPASALSWELILQHCPAGCHEHPVERWPGVDAGAFPAPDHDYPSHLELRVTATDADGLTDTESILLEPRTVVLTLRATPVGLRLLHGGTRFTTPFSRPVIAGSVNSIAAPRSQRRRPGRGRRFVFCDWSDGGARAHLVKVSADAEYTARYALRAQTPPYNAACATTTTPP
jgi:glucose/arabinose dehydrogenase